MPQTVNTAARYTLTRKNLRAAPLGRMIRMGILALAMLDSPVATDVASAQDGWQSNGEAVMGQPNFAASDSFGIMQIATNDPDQLMTEWKKPTPGVSVKGSTQIPRHRQITTFLIFKGCHADASGNCNVTADFDVYDPIGKPCAQSRLNEVWVNQPAAPGSNLQLSSTGFGLSFNDDDLLGAYRVLATVTDHNAGVTLHTEQVLTVLAK